MQSSMTIRLFGGYVKNVRAVVWFEKSWGWHDSLKVKQRLYHYLERECFIITYITYSLTLFACGALTDVFKWRVFIFTILFKSLRRRYFSPQNAVWLPYAELFDRILNSRRYWHQCLTFYVNNMAENGVSLLESIFDLKIKYFR